MADHLDEPPQKKAKKDPFQGPSDASSEYCEEVKKRMMLAPLV